MGKTEDTILAEVRKDIAAVVNKLTEIAHTAVASLTEEDIKAGFAAPTKEAPQWTRLVERVVGAAARSETTKPTQVNNSLNLVIVGKAPSTQAWLDQVKEAKAQQKQLEAIDVAAEPAK